MRLSLTNAILLAIVLAIPLGLAANWMGTEAIAPDGAVSMDLPLWADWLMPLCAFLGEVFLRSIKMLVAPLIFTAIVAGVASIPQGPGLFRLAMKTLVYYLGIMGLAVLLGLLLVNVIRPGEGKTMDGMRVQLGTALASADETRQSIAVREDRPESFTGLAKSIMRQSLTNPFESLHTTNVLGIITFALFIGFLLPRIGPHAPLLISLFDGAYELMIKLVHVVLWTAPFGAFGLLFVLLAPTGFRLFVPLGSYCFTIVLGLTIHGSGTMMLLLYFLGRMTPAQFFRGYREALAVALSTSSSSATLPVSMRCCEKKLGVPRHLVAFVLPLGSTVNMTGTALYEAVAAMFIAQVYGIEMSGYQQVLIFIAAMFAAIGAAGIPSAGLVTMFMVFATVGLPAEGIALIITVDRVLDMLRTVVNVADDAVGAVIIARSEGIPLVPEEESLSGV